MVFLAVVQLKDRTKNTNTYRRSLMNEAVQTQKENVTKNPNLVTQISVTLPMKLFNYPLPQRNLNKKKGYAK